MNDHIAEARRKVSRPQIRAVFLRNGARIEPDQDDLPDWIYESAFELLELAAPAVQGEPVTGWPLHPSQVRTLRRSVKRNCPPEIYALLDQAIAAPQPGEQQLSTDALTPVPDELFAAEFRAWWERHGQFCRAGGSGYECTFAFEAWRYLYPQLMILQKVAAKQQPAPDVAELVELVEAATSLCDAVENINDLPPVMYALQAGIAVNKVRDAVAALAAHQEKTK